MMCPNPLGQGVQTRRTFCDVLTGRDPADGIIVDVPPHVGPARISFDLHNRHMYSEELIKSNRAYRRYTATIGVLTMDNTLLSRAVVRDQVGSRPWRRRGRSPSRLKSLKERSGSASSEKS